MNATIEGIEVTQGVYESEQGMATVWTVTITTTDSNHYHAFTKEKEADASVKEHQLTPDCEHIKYCKLHSS